MKLCWFHCKGKSPGSKLHDMCLGQQLTHSAKWTSPGSGSWATTLLPLSHKSKGQTCCLDGKFVLPLCEATKSDFLKWLSGFLKIFRDDLTSRESRKNFWGASVWPGAHSPWGEKKVEGRVYPQGKGTKWWRGFPSNMLNCTVFKGKIRILPLAQGRLICLLCPRPWTLYLPFSNTPSLPPTFIHKKFIT